MRKNLIEEKFSVTMNRSEIGHMLKRIIFRYTKPTYTPKQTGKKTSSISTSALYDVKTLWTKYLLFIYTDNSHILQI
ncbi:winged helix-turn-helix domain-containing protein [Bacillus sp. JJ864]|uniref:winged helix-turn-helix domain-containing protein n=1 Tax=Bacillus sp. JJ864 TaxID=3122975 RepID=UPI003F68A31B